MSIGNRLRLARERAGLTQVEVCKRTGIGNKTISNYEKDVSSPDVDTLRVLCKLYDVSADDIIDVPGINDAITSDDEAYLDVRMIARGVTRMPQIEREKLKAILKLTFETYFKEDGTKK